MKTVNHKHFIVIIFGVFMIALLGCVDTSFLKMDSNPEEGQDEKANSILEDSKKFLAITSLGKEVIDSDSFLNLLSQIPSEYRNDRVFVVRVDESGIGSPYGKLDQWDLALENGLIKGLTSSGFVIVEKLDFVEPRDPKEITGNSPSDAFYMHGIDLEDHSTIRDQYKTNLILQYQVLEFSSQKESAILYFRVVNINTMKILASCVVKGGDAHDDLNKSIVDEYDRTFSAVSKYEFPSNLYPDLEKAATLDIDVLNIVGEYSEAPSKKVMAVENGLISGLMENSSYGESDPIFIEKSIGFKLKFPAIYNSIVFNTNPILYEEWSEFVKETGCTELIMYRYIEDEGLYIRILDAMQNGEVLFSDVIQFSDTKDSGIFSNHNTVAEKFNYSFNYDLIKNKKLILVDGDRQPVQAQKYNKSRTLYNEMHLSIEEGILSALVKGRGTNDYSVYEKLKTLYLKRSWMYEGKVFNLNPLYLDDWGQLREFGVDILILYNNLIPYEEINSGNDAYRKIALTYRVIDLVTGDVLHVGELSSLEGEDQ
jgi:hypothetical protein